MSDTTTGTAATASALSGAAAAVYTALAASPGITAADLATAAGVGRSTAGKALAALEQRGLATRTHGDQHNGRCLPDHWRATQPPTTAESGSETAAATDVHNPHPISENACKPGPAAEPTAPDRPRAEDSESSAAAEHAAADTAPGHAADVQQAQQEPQPAPGPAQAAPVLPPPNGQKTRLAPGALRQLVIDHLTAHPGEAFTATRISRAIGKSSGAIANCLVTLVGHGVAEQVSERPRTYRLAVTEAVGTA